MTKFFNRYQTTDAIQWTGENLAEVLEFTGKHPSWDQWFPSFEAYEARVKKDGDLFKVIDGPSASEARPGDWVIRSSIGYHHVMSNEKFVNTFVPQGQAAVAAALEAAAGKAQMHADHWRKAWETAKSNSSPKEARDWQTMMLGGLFVKDSIRALITPAQHDALAAHVAAEGAKARAEDAAKLAFPADVLEFALKIGRAEWGQTDPKTAAEHATDMASTVEKTAAYFGQTEPQSLNGLYIEGTGIVICHTGVSPNSPEIARILTGLWNMIYDTAQIGAKP